MTDQDTPTPRTDARAYRREVYTFDTFVVSADFARTLERELTAARAEVETYRDSCAAKADRIDRLGETVVGLRAEVEALRAALERLVSTGLDEATHYAIRSDPDHYVNAALAKEKAS